MSDCSVGGLCVVEPRVVSIGLRLQGMLCSCLGYAYTLHHRPMCVDSPVEFLHCFVWVATTLSKRHWSVVSARGLTKHRKESIRVWLEAPERMFVGGPREDNETLYETDSREACIEGGKV